MLCNSKLEAESAHWKSVHIQTDFFVLFVAGLPSCLPPRPLCPRPRLAGDLRGQARCEIQWDRHVVIVSRHLLHRLARREIDRDRHIVVMRRRVEGRASDARHGGRLGGGGT